jgi:hypothetical protein
MITEESSWQSSIWNKCESSVLSWLDSKNAQKPTWLARICPCHLHENAHPHLGKGVTNLLSKYEGEWLPHAPYSPDMNPPDFDLFHMLKEPMRGHRFPSPEEASAAVTRAIRGLNQSATLNGIANLQKRWDAGIEKQGPT